MDKLAFPLHDRGQGGYVDGGMTLRDYFAAAALTGFVAANQSVDTPECRPQTAAAVICYALADAMLAARGKETP